MDTLKPKYKRVLLKISGEALAAGRDSGRGIDFDFTNQVCLVLKKCVELGIQVSIVVGAGNFWRGLKDGGDRMVRTRADYMGMLATTMNSLALLDALEKTGVPACVQSAIGIERIAQCFSRDEAVKLLEAGKVVIFACGTGEPYFSTDTAAVLRALEVGADALLLAKNIDGVYSADPKVDSSAYKFDEISYAEVVDKRLAAMDMTATTLAMENGLPCVVFGLEDPENIIKAVMGEKIGTTIY
jgi:uridylate kinase